MVRWPPQRWLLPSPVPRVEELAHKLGLSPLTVRVLWERGLQTERDIRRFLAPQPEPLPPPAEHFRDLPAAVTILEQAARQKYPVAICGDYDADGMTSTALLLRLLRGVGITVDYAIPSRMQEGYGINERIVREFHAQGVRVLITVDNGIAAPGPVALAVALGMQVIITDHHEPPPELPPAQAILNPRLLPADSPYRSLAGVGVAYILGQALLEHLGYDPAATEPLLELFTLGTIADLAPLTGVNRRWVKQGLHLLAASRLAGVRALITVAGLAQVDHFDPDHIGFQLGPRLNAIGRLGDPQVVIELLTTDDPQVAQERAQACEAANQERRRLCDQIEQEAIALWEQQPPNLTQEPVQVLVQPGWHHGVVGIVASRLVERYGVPVFLGTYEDEGQTRIRGSARGIPEFHVYEALHASRQWLERYGGHRAAGGFSLQAAHFSQWKAALQAFGRRCLQPHHLQPLLQVHAQAQLGELTPAFYDELQRLQPYGIDNPTPQFWSARVRLVEQATVGKDRRHAKFKVRDRTGEKEVVAWGWAEHLPLPDCLDIAYTLRRNEFQGREEVQLELLGARRPLPQLEIPLPPSVAQMPTCQPLTHLEDLVAAQPTTRFLLYGYRRPTLGGYPHLTYDRPTGEHDVLILWTLPPDPLHLRWLVAKTKPQAIYLAPHRPPVPAADQVLRWIETTLTQVHGTPWNLLAIGQQYWVSPAVWVAGLRLLGYDAPDWPATDSLVAELARLATWYRTPWHQLTAHLRL